MGWLIVALVVTVLVVWVSVVLSRRSPARLSEEDPPGGPDPVADRPAGPGAEATGVDGPGGPLAGRPPEQPDALGGQPSETPDDRDERGPG